MERINELIEGYSLENIWNMVESGCFFKALLDKGLVEKGKQAQGSKKSKKRLTVAFFVNAAGEKVGEPIVIWKSKLSRCFKKLQDPSRPANVHYFSNPKSWMTSEVMAAVLARFKRKLVFEDRKVILFLFLFLVSSRIYDWSVFAGKNHFLTEKYNFEATTTGCWHHPKF